MLQFHFSPFPELKTGRLILRRLTPDDAPAMFLLRSNESVLKHIGREPIVTLKEAAEFIEGINNFINKNESILWGIALSNDPATIIGTICYWQLQPENYRAEIGYALHPDHWRKGIMKEAIIKVLEYGFGTMKLHSVEARLSISNTASIAILEKTGFVKEGHLKDEFFFRGKFEDSLIYSRLE